NTSAATVSLVGVGGEADGEQVALGLLVSDDGLLVTKASELNGLVAADLFPKDNDRGFVALDLIGTNGEFDIALLQLAVPDGLRVPFVPLGNLADAAPAAGTWLVSVEPDPDGLGPDVGGALAIGNVSVGKLREIEREGLRLGIGTRAQAIDGLPVRSVRRGGAAWQAGIRPGDLIVARDNVDIESRQQFVNELRLDRPSAVFNLTIVRDGESAVRPVRLQRGQLGVTITDAVRGLDVNRVFALSPAQEAGVKVGDLVTTVEGTPITQIQELNAKLDNFRAGDRVKLGLIRDGLPVDVEVRLGGIRASQQARFQNFIGGSTFSRRSSDFPAVIQHDTVLPPNRMGGPVINARGDLLGINIARAGRVKTYAVPASELAEIVEKIRGEQESD
ncbi:MAG: PDZ domain-containing protein, partial [Planctomycetota bacterium]